MDDTNFFANAAAFLKTNAITEADYRFDRTLDKLEKGDLRRDDNEVGMKIAEEFKTLGYSSPGLATKVQESWKGLFAREQEDVVNQIKSDVQGEVEEAQQKNQVVELAVQEIHDAGKDEDDSGSDTDDDDDAAAAPPSLASHIFPLLLLLPEDRH